MFYQNQLEEQKKEYKELLKIIGSLSRAFSNQLYLDYRILENVFCTAFEAKNLGRKDVAVDAIKDKVAIGIKTFLGQGMTKSEKIAEMNKEFEEYSALDEREKIVKICNIRNDRIDFIKNTFSQVDRFIYHYIVKNASEPAFYIHEVPMDVIDVDKLKIEERNESKNPSIFFNDGKNSYKFYKTKSTLYNVFSTKPEHCLAKIDVQIFQDPWEKLKEISVETEEALNFQVENETEETVYLPFYGTKNSRDKIVYEKSGLNQWNAGGRKRNSNEVYIRIPKIVYEKNPHFFPKRDFPFDLKLPNGNNMSAKVCQEGGKALMSNPNKELGQWLLRDVLGLKNKELLTYDKLQKIGVDCVRIDKINEGNFEINFSEIGKYEDFINEDFINSESLEQKTLF